MTDKTTEAEKPTSITALIPLIREKVGAIAKDLTPESGNKYSYRSSDQIINAIVPVLNEYGVFTTVEDELLEHRTDTIDKGTYKQYLTYAVLKETVTFHAPDGSTVSSTVVSESTDYSDKALGAAGTYAYRTALVKTFTIPTGDDPEGQEKDTRHAVSATPAAAVAAAAPNLDPIKSEIVGLLKANGTVDKALEGEALAKRVAELGSEFFDGRPGWNNAQPALEKWKASLSAGEVK